ncbi:MAG: hypothetical protein J6R59_00540 [Paludibacteraceae bacterium]|nr:hypothetical protein [Paludibacteraceae bacterium]
MSDVITIKKLEIPKEFRKDNMLRRLLKFEKGMRDVAIYEVIRENWQFGTGHRGYEVMIIRYTTKDMEYYGSVTPAGSPIFPSNEQFGQSGWHFNNYDRALKKFNELLVEPIKKGGRKSNVVFI